MVTLYEIKSPFRMRDMCPHVTKRQTVYNVIKCGPGYHSTALIIVPKYCEKVRFLLLLYQMLKKSFYDEGSWVLMFLFWFRHGYGIS